MRPLPVSIQVLLNSLLFVQLLLTPLTASEDSSPSVMIPRLANPVKIDGYLNELAWREAVVIQEFYTYRPVDGQLAEEETAALLAYDAGSLYLAFICFDPQPDRIRSSISKRDDISDDDNVVLYLDTFKSGKETYYFSFNPDGIQGDGIYIDMIAEDSSPDFIIYSKGRRFKSGYIVEVEIPFKSIRFPSEGEMEWGICLARSIKHLDKDLIWPAISRNSTTFVPQFATLFGLSGLSAGKNIEILPEATASQHGQRKSQTDGTEKFVNDSINYGFGVNLKFGIFSNLIFDLTYNPDFSQVEADADRIDVNRRFPLYYTEKRPFFLEGTNIFHTPINAVYTRRIVDPLAGAKLSGNLNGLEVGFLGGVDEYYGSTDYLSQIAINPPPADTAFRAEEFIDKYRGSYSYHTVLRLRKEVWEYSKIGILFTDKQFKDTYSRTYGIDASLLIADEYSLTFQALNSDTKDFFDQTPRSDPAFNISLYRGSSTLNVQVAYKDIFPDFEVANGFLERDPDYREGLLQVWYDIRSDNSFFSLIQPTLFTNIMFNHDSISKKIESYFAPSVALTLLGQNTLTLAYYRQFEEYLGENFDKNQFFLSWNSQTLHWLFTDLSVYWGDGIYYYNNPPFPGKTRTIRWGLEFKPINNWSTQLSASHYTFNGENAEFSVRAIQDIFRVRSVYQFNREISLRVIVEQNNYYQDLDLNILAGWHPSPGTVIFFGYNDYFSRYGLERFNRFSRGLFFKFSYLFRL